MRFAAAHKLVTYLLVAAALAAAASTSAVAPASAFAFLIACALSFGVEGGSRVALALDRAAVVVRFAALALFVAIGWRLWRRLPDPDVAPAFDLALALLGYKLFFRRVHRDYVHVAALTFLLVLIASTIAHSFVFVATFAIYVVVAVWALTLFHLRREMEENYLIKHSAQAPSQKVGVGRILGSRRVVGGTFFAATAAMAAAVFVGAVAIFMLVPRVGAGFAVGVPRMSGSAAGFADEIAIGRYGTLSAHRHDVVLRATFEDGAIVSGAASEDLYFRGAAYDGYESGRWVHSHKPELRTTVEHTGGRFLIGEERSAPEGAVRGIRQEIEAIGIPASVMVAVDRPRAFELPATKLGAAGTLRVFPRWSGEAALRVGGGEGDTFITLSHAHYVAYSRPGSDSDAGVASASLSPAARAAYLAVPEDLRRRLVNLAATLGDPDLDGSDTIAAITRALREKHGYTLSPRPAPAGVDPVESFLLGEHAGHCELFASAAVLLLRVRGVPARYVTGFRGGEWNAVGNYVAVRDDRAHAWAEAFVPDRGWVRVDATPPGPPLPRAGHVSEVMDALDYFWNRWVVGYDLGRQLELARRAGRHLATPATRTSPARIALFVVAAGVVAAVLLAARRFRRRRGRFARDARIIARGPIWTAPRLGAIERLYRRTLGRLARAGWPRRHNETPHEYAQRVRASGLIAADEFRQLTERYTAARFGGHAADDKEVAELAAKLAIRTGSPSHTGSPPPAARG